MENYNMNCLCWMRKGTELVLDTSQSTTRKILNRLVLLELGHRNDVLQTYTTRARINGWKMSRDILPAMS
uniref:Uncharacterized protein n=1 Tax=Octopus bimaculoides TaxID=37653 RepID=A0A0L8I3M9_OCTBM